MTSNSAREAATSIAVRLQEHGYVAYFAGGCVRDRLLGIEPSDFDVATNAHPEQVKELFPNAMSVGESFGVMLVRRSGMTIEVATFRSDGPYLDGRHPEAVTFADEEADAARRDFTMNAIFEHPVTGTLVDYHNGAADIDNQVLRAVGDPSKRFEEDHLRVLRAIRFAARLNFTIEPVTQEALEIAAPLLVSVSRERIGGELRRMLAAPSRVRAIALMESLQVDDKVLGTVGVLKNEHSAVAGLGEVDCDPMVALAGWLFDRGHGTDRDVSDQTRASLLLSNHEHRTLASILDVVVQIETAWDGMSVADRKRLAVVETFSGALSLVRGRDSKRAKEVEQDVQVLANTGLAPDPFIDGDALIQAGLQPGVQFKFILHTVYDAQLEGVIESPADALEMALRLANDCSS